MSKSIQERFAAVAQRLRKLTPSPFPGAASDETIKDAEHELGVTFPESYRFFLKEFAAGDFPFEIFGVSPISLSVVPTPSFWHVTYMTTSERNDVEPKMRHHLVPFTPNGFGDHWCLDTSRLIDGECPVVLWNHERGEDQELKPTHATFMDWLEEIIDDDWILDYYEDERNFKDQ